MISSTILQFAFATMLPTALAAVFYGLQKRTAFGRMGFWPQQVIIGIAYGLIAVIGTEFGIKTHDATMNVRDAAPLVGGLLFGGPAGIIAGLIGGIERWFAALWGRGMFTRVACSTATIAAGLYAALLRKFMFDDKKPGPLLGFSIGIVVEVLHLMLVFITNTDQSERAFIVVRACSYPMIMCNALAVMLAVLVIKLLAHEPIWSDREHREITQSMQGAMFAAVFVAFIGTTAFTFWLQTNLMNDSANDLYTLNIQDTMGELRRVTPEGDVSHIAETRHVGSNGTILILNDQDVVVSSSDETTGQDLTGSLLLRAMSDCVPFTLFRATYAGELSVCMYGNYNGYQVVALQPLAETHFSRNVAVLVSAFMEVIIFATLFAVIYFLIKRLVVDNIRKINSTLTQITAGDLDVSVDVRSNEEFASLSDDINRTVAALKHAIAEAAARIDAELEYARTIQLSVLPAVFPPYPSHDDFQIYASMDAAREVGGDFYDFYLLDDDHLAFLVADVSGKGIPAAMFMMQAKAQLKSFAESGMPVEEVFTCTNNRLCEGNDAEMFVTCWMGVLNLATGHVDFANAGHNPPALQHAVGSYELITMKRNFVLAGMEDIPYRRQELTLQPGDTLFLYTDGVTEATDSQDELFGEDRLLASLDAHASLSVEDLCRNVHADVDGFVGEAPQFDDLTVLALRYVGRG